MNCSRIIFLNLFQEIRPIWCNEINSMQSFSNNRSIINIILRVENYLNSNRTSRKIIKREQINVSISILHPIAATFDKSSISFARWKSFHRPLKLLLRIARKSPGRLSKAWYKKKKRLFIETHQGGCVGV